MHRFMHRGTPFRIAYRKPKGGEAMAFLYLSPSTQEANQYVTGGSEEYWMNQLADRMLPWLEASGVNVTRNTPAMTAASSIRASNAGNYDFHLALHSNAAPAGRYGQVRGTDVYYAPNSVRGLRMAQIIADNLREIYPLPDRVRTVATTSIGEVRLTRAPAVLLELAYHDNMEDANWITENLETIAENLVLSVTEYFGLPLLTPQTPRMGVVRLNYGNLNLRMAPSTGAGIYRQIPNGANVEIFGSYEDWYVLRYGGVLGYAISRYIE